MTDDILFFCAKMMVGHDGLLSDMSVGRASLYQKIPSCPHILSHMVHFEVEFAFIALHLRMLYVPFDKVL